MSEIAAQTVAPAAGRLAAIWLKRFRRGPMDRHESAELVAGRGLLGNTNQGGKRQVTLLEQEAWQAAADEVGAPVPPVARRANLLLAGISLAGIRNRVLCIGGCRIRVLGETRPCERMDEAYRSLQAALGKSWRGGSFGEVLTGGTLAVGDPVAWEPAGGPGGSP